MGPVEGFLGTYVAFSAVFVAFVARKLVWIWHACYRRNLVLKKTNLVLNFFAVHYLNSVVGSKLKKGTVHKFKTNLVSVKFKFLL